MTSTPAPSSGPVDQDLLDPGLSAGAQRAGKALAKLKEAELLVVIGVEMQRRGLKLGELPKPRAPAKRKKAPAIEQLPLVLPVVDLMTDDNSKRVNA